MYCLTRPFVFSLKPCSQEWHGRAKYTSIPGLQAGLLVTRELHPVAGGCGVLAVSPALAAQAGGAGLLRAFCPPMHDRGYVHDRHTPRPPACTARPPVPGCSLLSARPRHALRTASAKRIRLGFSRFQHSNFRCAKPAL